MSDTAGVDQLIENEMQRAIRTLLVGIGENPNRDGLIDTPRRVAKSLLQQTWGHRVSEEEFLAGISRHFEVGYDQMVTVGDIWFTSLCEHHLAPFMGYAHVAYVPRVNEEDGTGKVLGISKLARLVRFYASRLQVQERMTMQIASSLAKILDPQGIGVWVSAQHTCMTTRGVRAHGAVTHTTDLRGVLRDNQAAREEFLALCRASGNGRIV